MANKCYRCGGSLKYYHGMLGYEAMKCQKCGHEYDEMSAEEFNLNKKTWEMMRKK